MHDTETVFNLLRAEGIRLFAGVPDSLLKDFCAYLADHTTDDEHVVTANEGNAIALAAGHYLGSGHPALVYMQNSGIGNAVNPLLSLVDREVYSVPMLLMIGWRGEPGVKDEPQHVKQGRIMPELLDAMELPWYPIDADTTDPAVVIAQAADCMRRTMAPVALLVRKGTFEKYSLREKPANSFSMTREAAIKCVVDLLNGEEVVVSTTGMMSRELHEYRAARGDGSGNDFLTVGSMGHASSIAMGIARTQPTRRIICLDGDGSVIMHMGALGIIGQSELSNFVHIVINNGVHDSVGGQPTVGLSLDVVRIAEACGYERAVSVSQLDALKAAFCEVADSQGPALLEVRVSKGARPDLGRPKSSPIQNRDALMQRLSTGGNGK
jgi:phosphonopyruvate decarboxylase